MSIIVVKKYVMSVHEVSAPILNPVTKFGGQPAWVERPQWPLSRATGHPMRFIGQFALHPALFGPCEARMAYLFMTDENTFVDGTWEPDGGENAIILQPGEWSGPFSALTNGPSLCNRIRSDGGEVVEIPQEYAVTYKPGNDPDILDEDEFRERNAWDSFCDYAEESKIGGTPAFQEYPQHIEFLDRGRWRLLVQLNSTLIPTGINFGDGGIGFLFLNASGHSARFFWQG